MKQLLILNNSGVTTYTINNKMLLISSNFNQNDTPPNTIAIMQPPSFYTEGTLKFIEWMCSEKLDLALIRHVVGETDENLKVTYKLQDTTFLSMLDIVSIKKVLQILDAIDSKPLLIAVLQEQSNVTDLLVELKKDRIKADIMVCNTNV